MMRGRELLQRWRELLEQYGPDARVADVIQAAR